MSFFTKAANTVIQSSETLRNVSGVLKSNVKALTTPSTPTATTKPLITPEQAERNKQLIQSASKVAEKVVMPAHQALNTVAQSFAKKSSSTPTTGSLKLSDEIQKKLANFSNLPNSEKLLLQEAIKKSSAEQSIMNRKEIIRQATTPSFPGRGPLKYVADEAAAMAKEVENSFDYYKEFAKNKLIKIEEQKRFNDYKAGKYRGTNQVGLLENTNIQSAVNVMPDSVIENVMKDPETLKEYNREIAITYAKNFLHEVDAILTKDLERVSGKKFGTTREVVNRISTGLKYGLTFGLAGDDNSQDVTIGGEKVNIPNRLVNISENTAAAIDFTSQMAGSLPIYSLLGAGVQAGLLATGTNMVKFANASPNFFRFLVRPLGEELAEMAIRKSAGQEYGLKELSMGMVMNLGFESIFGKKINQYILPKEKQAIVEAIEKQVSPNISRYEFNKLVQDHTYAFLERKQAYNAIGDLFGEQRIVGKTGANTPKGSKVKALASLEGRKVTASTHKEAAEIMAEQAKIKQEYKANNPGFTVPDETIGQLIQRKLQDKMNRLGITQKAILDSGGKITPESDAMLKQEQFIGIASKKIETFEDEWLMPFLKDSKNKNITIDELGDFVYAKHAPEQNAKIALERADLPDGGSGMTNKEAKDIIDGARKSGKLELMESKAEEFYQNVTRKRLEILEESGLETAETIQKMRDSSEFYVPKKGIDEVDPSILGGTGQGFSTKGSNFQKAKGRKSKARFNPVIQAVEDLEKTIQKAEKNKVMKSFLKLVEDNPNEKLWKVESQQYIPEFDKSGEAVSLHPKAFDLKLKDNILEVRVDGKIKNIIVHDTKLANAMKSLGVSKSIPLLNKANNYIRAVNTFYNPEFTITNFLRDIQAGGINIGADEGVTMAVKVTKDTPEAVKDIYKTLRSGKASGKFGEAFKELEELGGKTGFFNMDDVEVKTKKLRKMMETYTSDSTGAKMSKTVRYAANLMNDLNESVEMGVRTSAYLNLVKSGVSKDQAAMAAKNLTVNFNKKGEWSNLMNGLYLFSNAGFQSAARFGKMMKSARGKKIALGIITGSLALNESNRIIGGDDWDKISEDEKNRNLIIMLPNGLPPIKFPLPYTYNVLKIMGDVGSDLIHNKKTGSESLTRIVDAVDSSFNPLSSGSFFQFVSPTFSDPIVQLVENKNYAGNPIMPDQSSYGPAKKDSSLHFGSVRKTSKSFTDLLNEITGGNSIQPGYIDISPETIDHWVDFITGGVGKFVANSVETGMSLAQGEMPEIKNTPFVRKFVVAPNEYHDNNVIRDVLKKSELNEVGDIELERFKEALRSSLKDKKIDEDKVAEYITSFTKNQNRLKANVIFEQFAGKSEEEKAAVRANLPPIDAGVQSELVKLIIEAAKKQVTEEENKQKAK